MQNHECVCLIDIKSIIGVGWGFIITSAVCSIYYIVLLTWAVYYLGMSLGKDVPWRTCDNSWNTPSCVVLGEWNHTSPMYYNAGMSIDLNLHGNYSLERYSHATSHHNMTVSAAEEFWRYRALESFTFFFMNTYPQLTIIYWIYRLFSMNTPCGTLKCGNAAICEQVGKCEKISTLNVKIDAICEKLTLIVKK